MADNLQDLGKKVQDLAARSVKEQMRAAGRYGEFLQKVGRGELFKKPARDNLLRFVSQESTNYVSNMAKLSLDYYNELFELARTYGDKFYEQVVDAKSAGGATSTQNASAAASPRRVEIELRGTVGQEATRPFILESKRADAAEISFLVSDFVGPEGTSPFRPNLEFQPARFTLKPGEEHLVTLHLPLSGELFVAGLRYTATAIVRGYDDLELGITVLPSKLEDEPADSKAPSTTSKSKG